MRVSALTGSGLDALTHLIANRARAAIGTAQPPLITRARHRLGLEACAAALDHFLNGSPHDPELRAEDLRRAAHALGRITGRVDVEDVLDAIFARFCIGK